MAVACTVFIIIFSCNIYIYRLVILDPEYENDHHDQY